MSTDTDQLDIAAATEEESRQQFAQGVQAATSTETPRNEPEHQADAAPAIEYAQLTKAEVEELRSRAAQVDDLRATQDKSFGTFGRTIKGLQDTIAQFQAGAQVEISQEDIDSLREDFPPLAAALEKVRNMRAIPGGSADSAQIEELVQQRMAQAISSVEQKVELRLLAREHPDYKAIDADPAFAQWVAEQPKQFRQSLVQASEAFDSEVVGAAMSAFKAARKQVPSATSTRTSRQAAAVTPRGNGATTTTGGDDPASEFNAGVNSVLKKRLA